MYHTQQTIGILGGTFDPIHFGHLRTALEIQQAFDLTEVRLVPCFQPVHRKLPTASPEHRLAMARCAIEGESTLKVDDCEIQRKGPSYTIDTLEEIQRTSKEASLYLIIGIDALLGFTSWHRWEAILELAHLIVAHRPQYQLPKTGIIADLIKQPGKMTLHPVTPLEISATDIRKQIAMARNPRYLLPDSVCEYIQQHGVYSINRI